MTRLPARELEATGAQQGEELERLRSVIAERHELLLKIAADCNQLVVTG
ncbi:MAG TPA: hypothetical protein VIM23_13405 [Gaiellaceae bacterium]